LSSCIAGFGSLFLVRKKGGIDDGQIYMMNVLQKATVIQDKNINYVRAELQVLEAVRKYPFLLTLYYTFQTKPQLCLVVGEYKKCSI
jgi:ribosomal protein S6 kinase alpha-5